MSRSQERQKAIEESLSSMDGMSFNEQELDNALCLHLKAEALCSAFHNGDAVNFKEWQDAKDLEEAWEYVQEERWYEEMQQEIIRDCARIRREEDRQQDYENCVGLGEDVEVYYG